MAGASVLGGVFGTEFMRSLLIALGILTIASGVRGDELKPRVERLVRQLTSPELSKRADAEDQLIALGPQVLELLPAPAEDDVPAESQKRETIAGFAIAWNGGRRNNRPRGAPSPCT